MSFTKVEQNGCHQFQEKSSAIFNWCKKFERLLIGSNENLQYFDWLKIGSQKPNRNRWRFPSGRHTQGVKFSSTGKALTLKCSPVRSQFTAAILHCRPADELLMAKDPIQITQTQQYPHLSEWYFQERINCLIPRRKNLANTNYV